MKRRNHGKRTRARLTGLICLALICVSLLAASDATDFLAERRKFREQIKNKVETKLDDKGEYLSVIFNDEQGKYDFKVTDADRGRLKKYMASVYGTTDEALLEKMAGELNRGHYVLYKEYQGEDLILKVMFLSPKAEYWQWLTDGNGIENMFHTYNFSVGLGSVEPNAEIVILQTEGSFFGVSQAVTLPIRFEADESNKRFNWRMPTQSEIGAWLDKMPPINPDRTTPEEKFVDACRQHPFFAQKKGGEYVLSHADVLEYHETTVARLDDKCPVKTNHGYWKVSDDYPYLVVEYNFSTTVNIDAFIPASLRFLSGTLEDVAQGVTDEVSVKYVPLSMKNFRDFTQEWTKTGGPK